MIEFGAQDAERDDDIYDNGCNADRAEMADLGRADRSRLCALLCAPPGSL